MATKPLLYGIFSTSRPATSLLLSLLAGLFLFLAGLGVERVFHVSSIIFLLCLTTFTINDLIDCERDKVNHPNRFLATNSNAKRAAALYYALLVLIFCLAAIEFNRTSWFPAYPIFLIFYINYSILKAYIPIIKDLYIASINILFCLSIYAANNIDIDVWIFVAGFFFLFSREVLLDIPDIDGDLDSIAKRIGPHKSMYLVVATSWLSTAILIFLLWNINFLESMMSSLISTFLTYRTRTISSSGRITFYDEIISAVPLIYCAFLTTSF